MRVFHQNKKAIYPEEPWTIREVSFDPVYCHRNETIFALGNGYLGLRGNLEEGVLEHVESTRGIYINGIYETEEIIYGEFAPKQPKEYQSMINIMDFQGITLQVDSEPFSLFTGEVLDYERTLDLKQGLLTRRVLWKSPLGKEVELEIERLVSQANPHLIIFSYSVTPKTPCLLTFSSTIQGRVRNDYHLREEALETLSASFEEGVGLLLSQTKKSGFQIGCAMVNLLFQGENLLCSCGEVAKKEDLLTATHKVQAKPEETFILQKYVAVTTSRDTLVDQIPSFLKETLEVAQNTGFSAHKRESANFFASFWDDADVEICGDLKLQQGFRFNAFHLLQSTGRCGRTNVAAKGLTGEYYEGHYFWDTETYIIPFFLYNRPELVKNLLLYRYSILPEARENALRMRDKGALFAWRTINGNEASGNFLGSTVQYHINADIAFAVNKYVEATEDYDFLIHYGAEILFETARCFAHRGAFIASKGGKYCLNAVCGPDEYKPCVNNNCYTNYMAKLNFDLALKAAAYLKENANDHFQLLCEKLALTTEELDLWQRCSKAMYLPFEESLGVHPQDDSFLHKDPIDVDSIPDAEIPLVANWHPLTIWRYQIIKQADVILLMFLLGNQFSKKEKKANFDYYEPKTTHDSSLSPAIYSIIAAEIGYHKEAYNYFAQTARLDLDDYNKNVWQGVHTACMAGSFMCVVNGFAGLRTDNEELRFHPLLPDQWESYSFKLKFKGRKMKIEISREKVTYILLEGAPLSLYHKDKAFLLRDTVQFQS